MPRFFTALLRALPWLIVTATAGAQPRFQAEGSDTGAGLGARYVALGGLGVALADDVHALYYNPAGLTSVRGVDLSVSRQLNAQLHAINFAGAAWALPLPQGWGWQATLGLGYYPRIHARAAGAFSESDFESVFLRYLLPGINGTFDGDIDTKTKSYRLGLGLSPRGDPSWSAGFYLERIDCRSNFCGLHATSNGFTTKSTGAKATAAGFGLRWRPSPSFALGLSLSDMNTRLTVNSITTDNAGTRTASSLAQFPRKWALEAAWRPGEVLGSEWRNWQVAAGYDITQGRYGSSQLDLQFLRVGAERTDGPWRWRAGALAPLLVQSSASGRLKPPFPLAPSLGVGWHQGAWRVDLALYAHAVMSMHKDRPVPAADLSLGMRF